MLHMSIYPGPAVRINHRPRKERGRKELISFSDRPDITPETRPPANLPPGPYPPPQAYYPPPQATGAAPAPQEQPPNYGYK